MEADRSVGHYKEWYADQIQYAESEQGFFFVKITACVDQAPGGEPTQLASLFRWNSSLLSQLHANNPLPAPSLTESALIRDPGNPPRVRRHDYLHAEDNTVQQLSWE